MDFLTAEIIWTDLLQVILLVVIVIQLSLIARQVGGTGDTGTNKPPGDGG